MPDNDNMLRPEITGYVNHKIIANTIPITGDIKNSKQFLEIGEIDSFKKSLAASAIG